MAHLSIALECPEFFDESQQRTTGMPQEEIGLNCTLFQSLALNLFDLQLVS